MPRGAKILGKPIDEGKWERAKERAAEEGHDGDYAYVMEIYKRMTHSGEFKPDHVADRAKKGQSLPDWKKKKWDSDKHELKVKAVRKSIDTEHMRLVLVKGDLDEFRCGACHALLFKGLNLEKSMIEVKCRSCGTLLVSEALLMIH